MTFRPVGFSETIFKDRYALTKEETWEQAMMRVATQMSIAEKAEKQEQYKSKFYDILVSNYFVPGGRILYNSGRNNPNLLNCFVLSDNLDSKEGWGNLAKEMITVSMAGGGCGINFSDVRPNGAPVGDQKGTCPGPVELMRLINACAEPVRNGGSRRVALMFSLDLDHPDIEEFLDAKLEKGQLTFANVSVRVKKLSEFQKAVLEDGDWELSWKGQFKKKIKAKPLWKKIVQNAYNSAEPGILNWELVENESNIYYIEELATTNPCFSKETLITTDKGLFPIEDLVGKKVKINSNGNWIEVDNFRVTGENKEVLKVTLQDGSTLRVTPNHKMIMEDGSRKEASQLEIGEKLLISEVETHGNIKENGAYLKGFLCGDGTSSHDRPILRLYNTKYSCENRLINSAREIPNGKINTNVSEDLIFTEEYVNRKTLLGLTPKKHELFNWCTSYKEALPKEIFQWDKQSKLEFITGVMDADGTAQDSPTNGFRYQLTTIHKKWLQDFQTLLKSVGIRGIIGSRKSEGMKDFNDGYGPYPQKDSYRITINQENSIKLSKQIKFERLVSFKDKEIKLHHKPRFNIIKNIELDGIEEKVYCCTVPNTHSLTVSIGIETGNCGEIAISPYDCCCLGHLVLPRFIKDGKIDYALLANTIRTSVRFLDNVLSVNHYPLPEMKAKSHKLRRIGLGSTGLADLLAQIGIKYGSEQGIEFIDKLYKFIAKTAYESSVMLAVEKGMFPACNSEKHVQSGFMKRMPAKIRSLVAEHGIRNCCILTQAPTGTVSILSGNCSSGIEPMFSYAYERRYFELEQRKTELVFHPLFEQFMSENKDVSHFVASHELDVKQHMEVQATVQKWVDNAVSKTINMSNDYPIEDMEKYWFEYLPKLKGTTFYREGTRGYVRADGTMEPPPLTPLSMEEAKRRFNEKHLVETNKEIDCASGICMI